MVTLLDKITLLRPNAKCSVWETSDVSEYQGEGIPAVLCGRLVDWRGPGDCPTEAELSALGADDNIKEAMDALEEETRKVKRDEAAKSDLALMNAYRVAKREDGVTSLRDFLDNLETFVKEM